MYRTNPLRVITPLSPPRFISYINSPLFTHRYYLSQKELNILEESEEYLSGRKKQELTSWWLQYIEDNVDKYLIQKGYDTNCVPYHYLDKPPSSISRLHENISIVRKLLGELGNSNNYNNNNNNSNNNNYNNNNNITRTRIDLVNPIKRVVYGQVDELCNNLKLVLWDKINGYGKRMEFQHINDLRNTAFIEEGYLLLNTIRECISPDEAKGLQELIDDIKYINEIRKLDEIFFEIPHSSLPSSPADVVPITGLIVNKIHRLENELKTVNEHWSGRASQHNFAH